ncbi:hypothetical protein PoB_001432900 [Plakobranchus ocellatus]|uniref:Uncharacterized protein n=1 Tax=Plakobranchus ocellatus TaxID=259542 RepID=A0AAV3YXP6_9GAST|nr:hypothetical protein PoB_001432900 [Plakobranchus ocellatus]
MASEPLLPVVLFFRGLHPEARAFDAALVRVMKPVMEHLEHFIGVGVLPPTPPRSCPQQGDLRLSGPPSGQGTVQGSNPRQKDPCRPQGGFAVHCATAAPPTSMGQWARQTTGKAVKQHFLDMTKNTNSSYISYNDNDSNSNNNNNNNNNSNNNNDNKNNNYNNSSNISTCSNENLEHKHTPREKTEHLGHLAYKGYSFPAFV